MAHSCKLALVAYSDTGLVRERNEDQVLLYNLDDGEVLEHDQVVDLQLGPRGALACVFDGMGGAASGDVASKLASDVVRQVVGAATIATRQDLAESLGEAVVTAHRRIREYGAQHGESRGLGTTFTGAAIYDNSLVVAHVGDSRAYLLRRGALVQLTEDQSLLQELVTAGRLRPEEASEYEHSNVILQALGVNQRVFPVIGWLPLQDGDRIVLCSDGLSDLVAFEELYELLDDEDIPQQQVGVSLIEAAKTNGGARQYLCRAGRRALGGKPDRGDNGGADSDRGRVCPRQRSKDKAAIRIGAAFSLVALIAARGRADYRRWELNSCASRFESSQVAEQDSSSHSILLLALRWDVVLETMCSSTSTAILTSRASMPRSSWKTMGRITSGISAAPMERSAAPPASNACV
jgi:serine/threonine protein phosphatase PrpC